MTIGEANDATTDVWRGVSKGVSWFLLPSKEVQVFFGLRGSVSASWR